jgi:hypothetical protein
VTGVASVMRTSRGQRLRAMWDVALWTLTCTAVLYLVFLGAWGLNYRRVPLAQQLDFNRARVTPEAVRALNARAAAEAGRLRPTIPAGDQGWPSRDAVARALVPALDRAVNALGLRGPVRPGRPKTSMLDPWFTRTGVSGMTDPFVLETIVAGNILPFEWPMVVAHEWGHLAGLARESEASYFAWVACLGGDAGERYSAWLETFILTAVALTPDERAAAVGALPDGVRADLRAMHERSARDEVRFLSAAAWTTYDGYLKANGVASGVRNYGEVVQLMVGVRVRGRDAAIGH